ncbi:hypothetical protein KA977_10705, partial [Candidatus Dependentiae bacterium]|nr:hypothetical protein [Candidatus Dependentiae bacterium]
ITNSIFKSSNIEYTVNSINDYEKFSEVSLNKISNIGTGIYFNDKLNKYKIFNINRPDAYFNSSNLDFILEKFTSLKKTYPLEKYILGNLLVLALLDFILMYFIKKYSG